MYRLHVDHVSNNMIILMLIKLSVIFLIHTLWYVSIITSNEMMMLKSYVQFYSHGIRECINKNDFPWLSRLPGS
jgi:hypothetical protein